MEGTRKNRAPFPRLSLGPGALLNVGASKNLLSSRNVSIFPEARQRGIRRMVEKIGEMRAQQ